MNGVPPELHKYFGADYRSAADDNSEEAEDSSTGSLFASGTDGSQDSTMGSKEGEEYSLCESESEFSNSFDSPDFATLSLSSPEAGPENMHKKNLNPDKQKTPKRM
jgi:hypothetical protein